MKVNWVAKQLSQQNWPPISSALLVLFTPHSIHHAPWAIYAHAQTMGCAIHALHTHVHNPCPPSDCITCAFHLTPHSIHHAHLHLHPSPHVVICHRSLAILVHGHIRLVVFRSIYLVMFRSICLVAFRSTPHARVRARSCAHLPTHKDPDTPHAHVPLPSLKRVQSSTRHADTARQGGGGACYPPTRAHCQTDTLAPKTYM